MITKEYLVEKFIHLLNKASKQRHKNNECLRSFFEKLTSNNPAGITVHDIGMLSSQTHPSPEEWFLMVLGHMPLPSSKSVEEDHEPTSLTERVRCLLSNSTSEEMSREAMYLENFLYGQLFTNPGKIKVIDIHSIAYSTHTLPEEWFRIALYLSEGDTKTEEEEEEDFDENDW